MGHTYRCQIWGRGGDAFWQLLLWWLSAGIWVIHTGAKSGCKMVTLFDSYLMTLESVYGSPSLLNEYLWYDKLWGPSHRVVTLFYYCRCWGLCFYRFYHENVVMAGLRAKTLNHLFCPLYHPRAHHTSMTFQFPGAPIKDAPWADNNVLHYLLDPLGPPLLPKLPE